MTDSPGLCWQVEQAGAISGTIQVPGDKSISHRALMFAALAEGDSRLSGFLAGADTLATKRAFELMGVRIDSVADTELVVHGVGMHGLQNPAAPLDFGNSGTATRLMAGLLAGSGIVCEIVGDESLMQRPMGRVITPLRLMGADITGTANNTLPIKIGSVRKLRGIEYTLPVASAQLKSCLLLAGMYADPATRIKQPAPSRDHTERLLRALGADIQSIQDEICMQPVQHLKSFDMTIPADISSTAFFIVAALITPGSNIIIPNVGINPTRDGVLTILKQMGGAIILSNQKDVSGEPVADIQVKHSALKGIVIDEALVPNAIDEFPAILIAAAAASGTTKLTGAEELRVKESDRIAAMSAGLSALGVTNRTRADGIEVDGGQIGAGSVDSHTDHRIAMAFTVAGLVADGPVKIRRCDNVTTSFPGFFTVMKQAGVNIRTVKE